LALVSCGTKSAPPPPSGGGQDALNSSKSRNSSTTTFGDPDVTSPAIASLCTVASANVVSIPQSVSNPSPTASPQTFLTLVAVVSYQGQIKGLIEQKCLSCHRAVAGRPDLTQEQVVRDMRFTIIATDNSDKIVSGGHDGRISLSATEKDTFKQWAVGGYALTDSATPTGAPAPLSSATNGPTTANGATCTLSGFPEILLRPVKWKECQTLGQFFDRDANKGLPDASHVCSSTQRLGNWCSVDGIIQKFGTSGASIRAKIESKAAEGFYLDQCVDGAQPFIMLVRPVLDGTKARLEILRLAPQI